MSWCDLLAGLIAVIRTIIVFVWDVAVFIYVAVDRLSRRQRRPAKAVPMPRGGRGVGKVSSNKFEGAVPINETPLIEKQRWQKKRNTLSGYYRTKFGAWRGEIIRRGDRFRVYIWLDPAIPNIERHNCWVCFHRESGKKYEINLALNPADGDPSAIVFYVQKLIGECFAMN